MGLAYEAIDIVWVWGMVIVYILVMNIRLNVWIWRNGREDEQAEYIEAKIGVEFEENLWKLSGIKSWLAMSAEASGVEMNLEKYGILEWNKIKLKNKMNKK